MSNAKSPGEPRPPGHKRRSFLKNLAGAGAILAGMSAAGLRKSHARGHETSRPDPVDLPPPVPRDAEAEQDFENILLRMQEDLGRALGKPIDQRRWSMVLDLEKCVGCHACTIACKAENKLPPGVVYRRVIERETGEYPNVARRFIPVSCMHCDDPPCVPVCPVHATYKRPDGLVEINYDTCIGCRYCIAACPYGARSFDWGEFYGDSTPGREETNGVLAGETPYEGAGAPAFEYGRRRTRIGNESPVGNARKCHLCLHRVSDGMLPACVSTCIGAATYFGDANDPDSLVAEQIASPDVIRLKDDLATKPKVHYRM